MYAEFLLEVDDVINMAEFCFVIVDQLYTLQKKCFAYFLIIYEKYIYAIFLYMFFMHFLTI